MRSTESPSASATALRTPSPRRAGVIVLALVAGLAASHAQAQTLRSRGTIDQLEGDQIGIKTVEGYRTFYKVAAYSLVTVLRPLSPAALSKGQVMRLAVGDELADGVFVAAAAQVFSAGDPTIGAARLLWDMTSLGSVVDATFDQLVDMPAASDGKPQGAGTAARLLVSGRPVTVIFPPGCPVTTLASADRRSLRIGTPVFVYGQMTGDHSIGAALADPGNLAPNK